MPATRGRELDPAMSELAKEVPTDGVVMSKQPLSGVGGMEQSPAEDVGVLMPGDAVE